MIKIEITDSHQIPLSLGDVVMVHYACDKIKLIGTIALSENNTRIVINTGTSWNPLFEKWAEQTEKIADADNVPAAVKSMFGKHNKITKKQLDGLYAACPIFQ